MRLLLEVDYQTLTATMLRRCTSDPNTLPSTKTQSLLFPPIFLHYLAGGTPALMSVLAQPGLSAKVNQLAKSIHVCMLSFMKAPTQWNEKHRTSSHVALDKLSYRILVEMIVARDRKERQLAHVSVRRMNGSLISTDCAKYKRCVCPVAPRPCTALLIVSKACSRIEEEANHTSAVQVYFNGYLDSTILHTR